MSIRSQKNDFYPVKVSGIVDGRPFIRTVSICKTFIRSVEKGDIPTIKEWMKVEGWNPGEHDVEVYAQAFQENGFFVLVDRKNLHTPLGCILAPQYGKNSAFIGLYIVDPNYRKKGHGRKIWNYAMERLSVRNNIMLYAVEAEVERYKNAGFNRRIGHTKRFQSGKNPKQPSENSTLIPTPTDDISRKEVRVLTTLRPQEGDDEKKKNEWSELCGNITKWLTRFTDHVNANFIESLLSHNKITAVIKIDSNSVNNEGVISEDAIGGLAILRPCHDGNYRLSMFASDEKTAQELMIEAMRETSFGARQYDKNPAEINHEPKDALSIFMDSTTSDGALTIKFIEQMEFVPAEAMFTIMCKSGVEQVQEEKPASAERFSTARLSLFSHNTNIPASTVPEPSATEEPVVNIGVLSLEVG